jgi:hypothetical protein
VQTPGCDVDGITRPIESLGDAEVIFMAITGNPCVNLYHAPEHLDGGGRAPR